MAHDSKAALHEVVVYLQTIGLTNEQVIYTLELVTKWYELMITEGINEFTKAHS